MRSSDFVDLLMEEFGCENDNQLARRLDVQAGNIAYWRRSSLTKIIVRNVLNKIVNKAIKNSFTPIVEFRELDLFHGQKLDTLAKKIGSKELLSRLSKARGIYVFYDSSGHVIYCGKTTKNYLLAEMNQAYEQTRPQYKRKFANRHGIFSPHKLAIQRTALYFSAYEVQDSLISNLEAFVTRIVPNNLINKRTERFT